MKKRLLAGFSLLALVLGVFFMNGCKDSAPTQGYVDLASIRFADFHQVDPIQIYIYPTGTTPDSISKTPTALTYGIVTPYFTNLPTNRTSGLSYHLIARRAGTKDIIASTDIVLHPGDKKTWLVSGAAGTFDVAVINDVPPAVPSNLSYFRFLNVTPDHTPLNLVIGDPINGKVIASNVPYDSASAYVGLTTARDTSVTFYVTDGGGNVLGRLAGIGIDSGAFHTVTWGGQDTGHRTTDPTTGQHTPDDSIRVRILDDNDVGHDITVPVPQTFRFNIINALIPPNYPNTKGLLIDYTDKGLNIIINNNTVYDYTGVQPYTDAPFAFSTTPSTDPDHQDQPILNVVPTAITMTDVIYVKMVKPPVGGLVPSVADSILFRFFAGPRNTIKSDLLYTIVIFDSVQKLNPTKAEPYDSAGGVATVLIPDIPLKDSAIIVLGNMLAPPNKPAGNATTNKGVFSVNGDPSLAKKVVSIKSTQVIPVAADGSTVTVQGVVNSGAETYSYKFVPEKGGIYEAFLVGERGHVNAAYRPRFIVVRVNPKTN